MVGAINMSKFVCYTLLLAVLVCASVQAQTLTVRLLNAKSGKPMRKQNITFEWDADFKHFVVFIGDSGLAQVEVPPGAKSFRMHPGPRLGKEPDRIAYQSCNEQTSKLIPAAEVLAKGVVPANVCGRKSIAPRPGEVVFWALPLPFWKPDFQ